MKDKLKKLKLDDYSPDLGGAKALAAEALGTFGLVLAAAGISSSFGAVAAIAGGVQGALAPGFALFTLVLLFGPISGASFNPAVSLALVLAGRLPKGRLVPYVVAECAGALAAGLVLRILLRSTVIGITTTQMPGLAAVLLEALATAWLSFAILLVTEKEQPILTVAAVIGGTLTVLALWVGPLTGGSFNPARSLGPALASLDFSDLWIYLLGPMLGGAAGAAVYKWFHGLR